jgi:flavorubredoxin
MWNGTKALAEAIAEGISMEDPDVIVKVHNIAKSDENDLITEVFRSKTVLIGSPTVSNSILHSVAGFLHLVKELKFKGKKAAAFGCYGWSGESVKTLNDMLVSAGFEILNDGFKVQWNTDADTRVEAVAFGRLIAKR